MTLRVLYHLSHHSAVRPDGWSGAPGEAVWVQDLVARIKTKAALRGIEVVAVDGDLLDHPEFHADYAVFIAPHYEANVHGSGGYFTGRALTSVTATEDDRLGAIFRAKYEALSGHPSLRMEWSNPNVTDYYGFRLTSAKTPGILIEHGVGWNVPAPYDYDWLRLNIDAIADVHLATVSEFCGVPAPVPVSTDYSVLRPSVPVGDVVHQWARIYKQEGVVAGVRAEVALAQALKETGGFTFTGIAQPEWNNPAGLGVTGAPNVGNRFLSKHDGVIAHLQHLLMYFTPGHTPYCFPTIDQRHFAHRGYPDDVRQLDGHWAVPGLGYGDSITKLLPRAQALLN